jgi:peptide/nickel transport system ATP-binding protein
MAGTGQAHMRPIDADTVLRAEDVVVEFPLGRSGLVVSAVAGISIDVRRGETLGLVGESGCGKTSLARAVMQLPRPTAGAIWFAGADLTTLDHKAMRAARTGIQMVFQDPVAALNPRRTLRESVREPLRIWGRGDAAEQESAVDRVLEEVGIDPVRATESRPHQFSGGQCQRVAIARALVLEPSLVICDEPVSSLDVSVRGQVLNLLEDLKQRHRLSLVFIAHDLAVVKSISDRIAVMYLGKLCEVAPSEHLYTNPAHPYTKVLIDAIPVPDPTVQAPPPVSGDPPSAVFQRNAPSAGCRFAPRCPRATSVCTATEPQIRLVTGAADADHYVACHHPLTEPAA